MDIMNLYNYDFKLFIEQWMYDMKSFLKVHLKAVLELHFVVCWSLVDFECFHYRAAIERENKDVRLEQIRLKATEQRETVLQSIKYVV